MDIFKQHYFQTLKTKQVKEFKDWVSALIQERKEHNDAFNELQFLQEVQTMIEYYEQNVLD